MRHSSSLKCGWINVNVRIYVERVRRPVRENYTILSGPIPVEFVIKENKKWTIAVSYHLPQLFSLSKIANACMNNKH